MTINEMIEQLSNGENSPAYELLDCYDNNDYTRAINLIKNYLKCDDNTAKICCIDFKTKVYDELNQPNPDLTPQQIAAANAQAQELLNKPKCPTCGSTNVEKISFGKKAVGGALFGLLSSDVRKSMHCKNCGYKW